MRPASRNCRRQRSHLLLVADLAQSAVEQRPQDGSFERLFDVPESAGLDGGHGAFFAAFPGDDNGGNGGQLVAEALEKRQAVHAGKLDVRNQNGGMIVGETSQGVFRAGNAQDVQAPFAAAKLRSRGAHSLHLQRSARDRLIYWDPLA